jgi:hypothetical protein
VTPYGLVNTEDLYDPGTLAHIDVCSLILFLKIEKQVYEVTMLFLCSLFQFMNHLTAFPEV